MQSIENIMKLRKGYAIKLHEYFKHVQNKVEDKISVIRAESYGIYQEENAIWSKLQEKKLTLAKFDQEIQSLSQAKGVLDKKRLIEVTDLREKLELTYNETKKEYQQFLTYAENLQNEWMSNIKELLLIGAGRQKVLTRLHTAILNTFPDLKNYCLTWKDEPINRLKKIIKDSKKIEETCLSILKEIQSIPGLNMDEQHVLDKKMKQIPKNCELLSRELDTFINNIDYLDILEKTKHTDTFVAEFLNIFKDTGFTSVRTSIRMVNNIPTTEKKLMIISENFQHIQIVFEQVLEKLIIKKKELMEVCTDADGFAEQTCIKWLNSQYQTDLNILEQINQKRNEFVVNETLL